MLNKIFGLLACMIALFVQGTYSQTIAYGVVIDEYSGKKLSQVHVLDLNSGLSTFTDTAGHFKIEVYSTIFTLNFTKIGFSKHQQAFSNEPFPLKISLKPGAYDLEEIEINTGYEWLPKERSTGSFVHLSHARLEAIPGRSILNKLDGIMPGLQFDNRNYDATRFNATPQITVRGMNSFNGLGVKPLIIVDNFPYEGDLSSIHSNDVESVTMLRDAAATSIWGAQAGNGVIVINLKRASKNSKPAVSWSSNLSIIPKPDLHYTPQISSSDFVDVELMLYQQNFYKASLTGSNAYRTVFTPVVQAMYDFEMGRLDQSDLDQIISSARNHDYRDEMHSHFYTSALNQQHHFSISNATEKYRYRLSLGMDLVNNAGNRTGTNTIGSFSGRLNNGFQFTKNFSIDVDLAFSLVRTDENSSVMYPILMANNTAYPYLRLLDDEGNGIVIPRDLNLRYIDTVGQGVLKDWHFNPLADQNLNSNLNKNLSLRPKVILRYQIKQLLLEGIFQSGFQLVSDQSVAKNDSYMLRDMSNRFTHFRNGNLIRPIPEGDMLTSSNGEISLNQGRLQARINERLFFNDNFSMVVGAEISDIQTQTKSVRYYGYNADLDISQPVNHVDPIPQWLGGTGKILSGQTFSSGIRRMLSIYGNASYSFSNKYIISGSARKDGSNTFGVKTNERWNPLWSVGVAWNAKNEKFFEDLLWLSSLKLRFTHGHSGSLGGTTSDRPTIQYKPNPELDTNLPSAIITAPSNPSLKWEDVQMRNIGLDFGLWDGSITGSIEYYQKKVTDLVSFDPLDITTGFTSIQKNVAGINGEGIDATLHIEKGIRGIKLGSTVSFSLVRDWVTEFKGNPASSIVYADQGATNIFPVIGKPLQGVYSFKFVGLDGNTGDPLGMLNGEASTNYSKLLTDSLHRLEFHGSARPLFFGFFNTNIQYRNFTIFANISYRAGHYFRRNTIYYYNLVNSWNGHSDFEKRWKQPGDELNTTIPSFIYPVNSSRDYFYGLSTATVHRGDVMRLQQVRLSYQYEKPVWGLKNINIGIHVNNIGILWSAFDSDQDPDYFSIPPARTMSFSLNFQF